MERLIQQRRNLSDFCPGPAGPHPVRCDGIYHAVPLVENNRGEFYCYYRARPGEAGLAQDCVNISANAAWHAATLHGAGADILIPDTTNLGKYPDPNSDLLNVRPVEVRSNGGVNGALQERHPGRCRGQPRVAGRCSRFPSPQVLFEEFTRLRQAGQPTPCIAVYTMGEPREALAPGGL